MYVGLSTCILHTCYVDAYIPYIHVCVFCGAAQIDRHGAMSGHIEHVNIYRRQEHRFGVLRRHMLTQMFWS